MFRKIREWNKLIKFIKNARDHDKTYIFKINTTSDKLIITYNDWMSPKDNIKKRISLNYD